MADFHRLQHVKVTAFGHFTQEESHLTKYKGCVDFPGSDWSQQVSQISAAADYRLSTFDDRRSRRRAAAALSIVDSRPLNVNTVILIVEAMFFGVEGRKNESFDFRLSTIDYR